MQAIRIYDLPPCRMVSSGVGMFGEERFDRFDRWLSAQPRGFFPSDFLFWDASAGRQGFHWLYRYEPGMTVPEEFAIIDFPGGFYAVATDVDQKTDRDKLRAELTAFLRENHLAPDPTRAELGHILTSPAVREVLGYDQMNYWFPVTRADG